MKKIIFMFVCLSVIALAGCKENNDEPPAEPPKSLNNTEWVYNGTEDNVPFSISLSFNENTFRLAAQSQEEPAELVTTGKYTYVGDLVTLTPDIEGERSLRGIVGSDSIMFNDDGRIAIFKRK